MKKVRYIFFLFVALIQSNELLAAGMGGGGMGGNGGPCPPHSACWCSTRPGHPACVGLSVPIDSWIIVLLFIGIGMAIYSFSKKSSLVK